MSIQAHLGNKGNSSGKRDGFAGKRSWMGNGEWSMVNRETSNGEW